MFSVDQISTYFSKYVTSFPLSKICHLLFSAKIPVYCFPHVCHLFFYTGSQFIFHFKLKFHQIKSSPLYSWYGGSVPRVKWLGHDVDHSLPSSAKIKEWSDTSASAICLHRSDRDNISFTFVKKTFSLVWVMQNSGL